MRISILIIAFLAMASAEHWWEPGLVMNTFLLTYFRQLSSTTETSLKLWEKINTSFLNSLLIGAIGAKICTLNSLLLLINIWELIQREGMSSLQRLMARITRILRCVIVSTHIQLLFSSKREALRSLATSNGKEQRI